ncbi:MAG: hypothetical protein CFH34_01084 [Alphaproteobacteria bacterium MarineAlpha9_Bin4]|nr:hypothetical protein [Pelagibacterales bacterium]PPR26187.1 MAG: hypothetical protein CFH34_01084 [Alphaproteobacteria bacterium MarineAlpha9_Bin4]|tara:strand:+ start:1353 stop:2006 length:654 start_codon:yes stop_codon:yes gene_type:complete
MKNQISIYLVFSCAFFILLCLSVWQFNKHKIKSYNKNLLSSKINQKAKEIESLNINIENMEIINIKGTIQEKKSLYFEPRTYKGKIGYHKLVPLKVGKKHILVNRGFTTEKKQIFSNKNKIEKINGLIIKFPKRNFFELENDVINNKWYSLNLEEISNFLNITLEPFLIYEMNNSSNKLINVRPNTISNINHLNYSLTWFLLALTLSIILVIFVRKS